ncbi:MAG: hypothetical protein RL291_1177 [Pseudomonadota bacterium]
MLRDHSSFCGFKGRLTARLKRAVATVTAQAVFLAPLAPLLVSPAGAQAAPRAQIMTRVEYEACQARDEKTFRDAIERLTRKGLEAGLANVDYTELVSEGWRRQNLGDVIDKLVDRATEEVRKESSWGQLVGSLWTKEKAQQLAVTVAERVYKSEDMKRALEGLAVDIGGTLGKRIEAATVATAEPAVECLEVFLGPRYGRTIARVVSTDVGKEYSVDSSTGQGGVSGTGVLSQSAGGITGAIILIMRRQLANLASRIGARLVGTVLSRIVSVSAGGIGVVLIALDVWSMRNGVLPIIATEMKSNETKAKVKEELSKEIREQIGENLVEISAQTANRVLEIWHDFKKANEKILELSEKHPEFRRFMDQQKPETLGRVTEAVGTIARLEGDAAVLKRLGDGSLVEIVNGWSSSAFEIARETKSIVVAGQWRALAGKDLDRVVDLKLHTHAKPDAFTPQSFARLLALGDNLAITRLAAVDDRGRNAILDLGAKDARELGRALDGKQLAVLGSYVSQLKGETSARLLRAVSTSPDHMALLGKTSVRDAIIGSTDQNAALGMVLASTSAPNPWTMYEHVKLITDGRVQPILLWEKHPGLVAGLMLALLLTLLMIKRLFTFRRRPRVVERRVEVIQTTGAPSAPPGKAAGPFTNPAARSAAPRIKTRE